MAAKLESTRHPGIYRKGKRYVVVFRDRDGRQRKEFCGSLVEAREVRGRRMAGDRMKPDRITVADYSAKWITDYRGRTSRGFAESTRRDYRRDVEKRVVPYLGRMALDQVDPGDVREWLTWLEGKGYSAEAIRKAKATASAMFATAVEERKARFNPALGVRYVPRTPVAPKAAKRPMTEYELRRFLEALPSDWRLFFELLAHTGMRIGELLGLRWANVDLSDHPHVRVREQVTASGGLRKALKTANAERDLPLTEGMARKLTAWRGETDYPGSVFPVFPSKRGDALDYANLRSRVIEPARQSAGLPWVTAHTFRRTVGSMLHDRRHLTDRELCDWLGHHDPAFTIRTYVGRVAALPDAAFMDELVDGGNARGNTGGLGEPGFPPPKVPDSALESAIPSQD